MSSGQLDEPVRRPRAASYGRGNQATGRYQPVTRLGAEVPGRGAGQTSRLRKARNRRRFWLFAVAILVAAIAGAATIAGAVAQPPTLAGPRPMRAVPSRQPAAPPATGVTTPGTPAKATQPPQKEAPPARGDGDDAVKRPRPAAPGPPSSPSPTPGAVVYKNCAEARKAGATPLYRGQPGYSAKLDKDGDGVACDQKKHRKPKNE